MRISKTNIELKNLNLLVILNTVLEAGSVSEAAKRLRMSQPNLSRALNQLREEFKDPLFVRTSKGITPTKRALDLASPLQLAMESLQAVYQRPELEITNVKRRFVIAATDYIEFLIAPGLCEIIAKEAPGITIDFRPSHGSLTKHEMESGNHDLSVLVVREIVPPGYFKQELFTDIYMSSVRKGHPILKTKCTLEKFLEYPHVLLNPQGTMWSLTDEKLQEMKKARHLVLGTPNALSSIAVIAKTDAILTATTRFVTATADFFPIETFKGPFDFPPIHISQVWHERCQTDPVHRWVREKIKQIITSSEA